MKKTSLNIYRAALFLTKSKDITLTPSGFTWTKAYLLHFGDVTASKYAIKTIDRENYIFLEWKSGDYITGRLNKPYYYVLKKTGTN
ncbi:hypothetical protein [Cellulosilyticum ruminicola]|uniref:hypothetical protein n=1 Tax=Cellulosilyticum ruminicola TaxID=425254 RepID=UPI0006CF3F7F|nr:hypothetical protein [Cellulosilyticum ruminicola]